MMDIAMVHNPWDLLIFIGLWALWLLVLLGIAILILAVLAGFYRGLKGIFKPWKRSNLGQHAKR